jgi:Tfp pilus assembly protein PilE
MNFSRLKPEKIVIVFLFAAGALAAIPSLQRHRQHERLTDGVSALARYSAEMESFYLEHARYDNSESSCGVRPPANTQFLSFSCRTDGESYTLTLRGVGALEGYEYVLDGSSQPRKTVRFAGTEVHANCWLSSESRCFTRG